MFVLVLTKLTRFWAKKVSPNIILWFQAVALALILVSIIVVLLLYKLVQSNVFGVDLKAKINSEGKDYLLFLDYTKESPAPPPLATIQNSFLLAVTPPVTVNLQALGSLGGVFYEQPEPEIVRYVVKEGDTVDSIAAKFGITPQTIIWANDLSENAEILPGKELVILPVSGALHVVRPNDTLSEIAKWYQAKMEDIIEFNHIKSPENIVVGDLLIIPGGIKPDKLPKGRLSQAVGSFYSPVGVPYRINQGLHPFNAVDFDADCGDSVYAAASGIIQRTGYSAIGGKYIRILHSGGVVTYYGHLSAILISPGQKVSQGQKIGLVGQTGYATGCHVHFEVRGAANPFAR